MFLLPSIHRFVAACMMLALLLPAVCFPQAQRRQSGILFYQLSTADGLSDNYIYDMCTDRGGNLWIATGEGLNMFNGTRVVKFFQRDYPQLHSNGILQLACDRMNRIWVRTDSGRVTLIDEQRKFHPVDVSDEGKRVEIKYLLLIRGQIVLLSDRRQWTLQPDGRRIQTGSVSFRQFRPWNVAGFDSLLAGKFRQIKSFDPDSYIFSVAGGIHKVNYRTAQVEKMIPATRLILLGRWDENKLLVYDALKKEPLVIDLVTHEPSYPFKNLLDQHGEPLLGPVINMAWIQASRLLLTTQGNGIYIYDLPAHQLVHYRHNAADQATIVNNSPRVITTDSTGWVFLGATPHGLSYFKSNAVIGQQAVFLDRQGNSYDGYITAIATPDNDTYYIGTSASILKWKRSTNTTEFLGSANPSTADLPVRYLTLDTKGRIWACIEDQGLYVFDLHGRQLKHLQNDSSGSVLSANFIQHIFPAPDGWLWLSTRTGICRVNPADFSVDRFEGTPLDSLKTLNCISTWFPDSDHVWIGTHSGAWQYNIRTRRLDHYTKAQGLPSDQVLCFNKDRFNNVYIGTITGLYIRLRSGGTIQIDTSNGLLNKRVEALLLDKNNRMWIGNDVALACFNIRDTGVTMFDERYGLSVQGFRVNAYCQNSDDELVWGTERGLQFFYPDDLFRQKINLPTTITRMESRDIIADLTQDTSFQLSSSDNYVSFYFSSIDYSKHLQTFYAYKLEGVDEDWIHVADQNFVRYNSLPPGKYVFKVRASNDNRTWEPAANQVTLEIAEPFWQTGWFRLAVITIVLLIGWWLIRLYRMQQKKHRDEIETRLMVSHYAHKMAESRLQSLRLQMNPHFLFNALNSIQQMILSNEEMVATRYLSRFSKLLRTILVHSDKEMVTLKEELDILNLYVGLESVRFKDSFDYSIRCDPQIDVDEVKLPTLLVQPFVENAIWHGLMHKEGGRQLRIDFTERGDLLVCVIEDNGVGREAARQVKMASGKEKSHTSKGIEVSMERLRNLHKGAGNEPVLLITDLKDGAGVAAGTRVEIHFPLINN